MGDPLSITASIIAILQAASVTVTYLDGVRHAAKDTKNLISELGSLQNILTSFQDYAGANPDSTTLQTLDTSLRECLSGIEELQARMKPKGLIRKGVLWLGWAMKGKEYREYLDKIERLKSSISLAMDLDRGPQLKAIAIRIGGGAEGEKRIKVLTWLSPAAYDERHLETSNRRQRNTGEWLLKKEVVVDWVRGGLAARLLVGYGIPGAGKTFLSSLMIDDLHRRATAARWGVAFMYFNHSEQSQQTPTFFLSSLVKQFAYQIVDLPEKPYKYFYEQLYELYDKLHPKESGPTFEQLYDLLLAVTKPFTQAFIICDALDECDQKSQRKYLLPLFNQMGEDGMRLFLTSREHPEDIQHSLQSAVKVKLSAQNEDIRVYIERKIAESPRAERLVEQAQCKEEIISELQACANGMFLLVHFHISYLCEQATPRQLLDALKTLKDSPSGESPMDPTYNRAMRAIQSQPKKFSELAINILTWLTKSQRVLSVRELQQAVSVEQHQTIFDELALPSEATMIDVCASLIAIDQESSTVRLVHYTVKGYLVNNPIIPKDVDFRIVMACVTFLSYEEFSGAPLEARHKMYPFLRYADMHFAFHLQQCDEALSLDPILRFLRNRQNVLSYLRVYLQDDGFVLGVLDEYHSIITLATCLGHPSVIQSLLKQGGDVLGEGVRRDALTIATSLGYNSVIEVLLENNFEATLYVLKVAVIRGHVSTTRLLIDKGVSVSGYGNGSPLRLAVEANDKEILRTLIKRGSDLSSTDSDGRTPLHIAAGYCYRPEIVRILVEEGADVSTKDHKGQTPLHIAARYGYRPEIVRVLVEEGADVSIKDSKGQTPLHLAVNDWSPMAVELLIEHGADVSATDNDGQTPLHIAVYGGIIKILIAKGTDVLATDGKGQTPLDIAVSHMYWGVVRALLERGADVSAAMHRAKEANNAFIIKMLAGYQVRYGTGRRIIGM